MKRYSQQDPKWKNKPLGNSTLTIGNYGCFLTCFSMLLEVEPDKVNDRVKIFGGFDDALLIAGVVPNAYPQITVTQTWCANNQAPLDVIDKALGNRQPVIVQVDTSPVAGIQSHFVILTGKDGNDYSMVDPWPLVDEPPATLLGRYGKGRDAKTIITYIAVIGGIALDKEQTTEVLPSNEPVISGGVVSVVSDWVSIRHKPTTVGNEPLGKAYYGMDFEKAGDPLPGTGDVKSWQPVVVYIATAWKHEDYLE